MIVSTATPTLVLPTLMSPSWRMVGLLYRPWESNTLSHLMELLPCSTTLTFEDMKKCPGAHERMGLGLLDSSHFQG